MPVDAKEREELEALRRDVVALRARVAELRRSTARHEETDDFSLPVREKLRREAERAGHFGTWTWEIASGRVTLSDEMFRILGLEIGSIEPSVETFYTFVHEEDRARGRKP